MALNEATVSAIAEKLGLPEVLTQFQSTEAPADGVNLFADALTPLQVFQQSQLDERLSNERTSAAKEAERIAVGNTWGLQDKRILQDTGIAKKDGESTIEYMARAAKEKYGTKADESEEMKQLRQAVADKDALLVQKNGELEQLKVTHATEAKTLQINARLDNAINALAIDAPAERLDSQREFLKFKFNQKYDADLVDGKVVFKDKAGMVQKDTNTASPLTEAALIAQFAPTVVSLKQSQRRGAGVRDSADSQHQSTDNFGDYPTVADYKKALTESGIVLSSQVGQDKIAAYLAAQK